MRGREANKLPADRGRSTQTGDFTAWVAQFAWTSTVRFMAAIMCEEWRDMT